MRFASRPNPPSTVVMIVSPDGEASAVDLSDDPEDETQPTKLNPMAIVASAARSIEIAMA